jgi:short-subunit dehydrogenase
MEKKVAIITGASSGIGKELARIHAERGGDLIIIARRENRLEELREELEQKHGVKVKVMAKDLTELDVAKEIYDEIKESGIEIDYLINNAGFGGRGKFHERDWETDLAMINLNIVALTALTRYFLPYFVERNEGKIMNTSSTAALMPGPLQAVYYASKAYVTSFSNAIAEELSDTNITVTAFMPGVVDTEFAETSGMEKTRLYASTFNARKVAEEGYDAMLVGKLNIFAGVTMIQRLMVSLFSFMPKRVQLRLVRRMQEV